MSDDPALHATRAWQVMAHFVIDHRGPWRRAITARTGLPFTNIRLLRRIARGPIAIGDLAALASLDAPATTVGVNELERRGLVRRDVDPANRRRKLVELTDAGRDLMRVAAETDDPAPEAFSALTADETAELLRLVSKLDTTTPGDGA